MAMIFHALPLLAETTSDQDAAAAMMSALSAIMGFLCVASVFVAALIIVLVVSMWVIYVKAGKPGWVSIIPIYNVIVLAEIVGKDWWWGLLTMIPFVGQIIVLYLNVRLAGASGKGMGYAIGMVLLPFVFIPMLAWGKARYLGPQAAAI
jgi:hypothetical protein